MTKSDHVHTVGVHEAKTQLSELLRRVEAGAEILICRNTRPLAKLVPVDRTSGRQFGFDRGVFEVPSDFDDPLPDELTESSNEVPARHSHLVVAPVRP